MMKTMTAAENAINKLQLNTVSIEVNTTLEVIHCESRQLGKMSQLQLFLACELNSL